MDFFAHTSSHPSLHLPSSSYLLRSRSSSTLFFSNSRGESPHRNHCPLSISCLLHPQLLNSQDEISSLPASLGPFPYCYSHFLVACLPFPRGHLASFGNKLVRRWEEHIRRMLVVLGDDDDDGNDHGGASDVDLQT